MLLNTVFGEQGLAEMSESSEVRCPPVIRLKEACFRSHGCLLIIDYSVDKGLQDTCNPLFIIMKRVGVNNRILNFLAKQAKCSEPTARQCPFFSLCCDEYGFSLTLSVLEMRIENSYCIETTYIQNYINLLEDQTCSMC
jgi:hypothetical protein